MDDIVAVRLRMTDGSSRYFITLGRIFDNVIAGRLVNAVLDEAAKYDLQGTVEDAHLCEMLREAADSNEAPYFYEALTAANRVTVPYGKDYDKWQRKTLKAMKTGGFMFYCGGPPRT